MTTKQHKFYSANFGFNEPFKLELANGEPFYAAKVLRLIPKRRLVAFGTWQGVDVVAKIFFDKKRNLHHLDQELKGVKALSDNKIPTSQLLLEDFSQDKRCRVLIFERLVTAKNLYDIWQDTNHISELLVILHAVITEIATQHVLGVVQRDIHLKNFLIADKEDEEMRQRISYENVQVYTLDGGQIERHAPILSREESIANLALFLSQFGVGVETYQILLFRYYAKQRGWLLKRHDISDLLKQIKKMYQLRWQNYQKKIFRTSSDFIQKKDLSTFSMLDRRYAKPELLKFIENPDAIFTQSMSLLKAGNSATVVKVTLDGKEYVIKRYNIKNTLHWLRRAFRESRAASSWRYAQKLQLFFVKTATPVAFIEQRFLGLRSKSYYVTEYVEGDHIGEFFKTHTNDKVLCKDMIERISHLLKNLVNLRLTHGDLKETNLLLDPNNEPVFIDLDGMQEHRSSRKLKRTWRKELARFLRNFNEDEIQAGFKKSLNVSS